MRRALPVLTLAVLAPFVAEASIADFPFTPTGAIAAVFLLPIYSGGAVFLRELVRRSRRGWASLLLLGAVYAILEEGIALQSFFSPSIYHAIGPAMGMHLFGINGIYTELQLVNHAVFSLAVPVLLTELAFPAYRDRPFLGKVGLVVSGVVYALGIGLTALGARTSIDPGFATPPAYVFGSLGLVVVLWIVALAVLPRRDAARAPAAGTAPAPAAVFGLGLVAAFGFLALLWIPGRVHAAFVHGPAVAATALGAAAIVAVVAVLAVRWSRTAAWDDRHRLALGAGALLGHSALGLSMQHNGTNGLVGGLVLLVVTVVGLALLARRVSRRTTHLRQEAGAAPARHPAAG